MYNGYIECPTENKGIKRRLLEEIGRTTGRIKFPERSDGPSRCEDIVVEALAVLSIVPMRVLHHLRIETRHADSAEPLWCGQELAERGMDYIRHGGEPLFARFLRQPLHDMMQFEHEDIDMVVFH